MISLFSKHHQILFERFYELLIDFGASPSEKFTFVSYYINPNDFTPYEYRFCGIFGMGGKFRYTGIDDMTCPFYADYYPETKTDELDEKLNDLNRKIKLCYDDYVANDMEKGIVVGTEKNYDKVLAEKPVKKLGRNDPDDPTYGGGGVFRSVEQARRYIADNNLPYAVYEIILPNCWEIDIDETKEKEEGFCRLLNNAWITRKIKK